MKCLPNSGPLAYLQPVIYLLLTATHRLLVKSVRLCQATLKIARLWYTTDPYPALIQGDSHSFQFLCHTAARIVCQSERLGHPAVPLHLIWSNPHHFLWLGTPKGVAMWTAAMPGGFVSSAQNTEELQCCKGQHKTQQQVKLSPLEPHWDYL